MKKAAMIMSSICFGVITYLLFWLVTILFGLAHSGVATSRGEATGYLAGGVILLLFTLAYFGFGLFLLIYTGKNVAAYNQTCLGVLILLFICVPGGILIICLPHNSQIYNQMNSNNRTSGFSRIMNSRYNNTDSPNRKCERCEKTIIGEGNAYVVTIVGNRKTICKNCYNIAKERGENIVLIKKV